MTRLAPTALALALGLAAPGCGVGPEPPASQIRALVARGEHAAEAKDLPALRALVSDRYADAQGHDRRAIMRLLAYHLLRHRIVHLVTRVAAIDLPAPDRAEVVVLAGMAGRPGDSLADLVRASADVYRFELVLGAERPGAWRVERAAWRPAEAADLLGRGAPPGA